MNYRPRPKAYGPTLDTDWGAYTSPYILYDPDQYMFRQPAAPQALVSTRHPVAATPNVSGIREPFLTRYQYGAGLSGFGAAEAEAAAATEKAAAAATSKFDLTGLLVLAGMFGLLYLITRGGGSPRSNPMATVEVPAEVLEDVLRRQGHYPWVPEASARPRRSVQSLQPTRRRRRKYSPAALKKLRSVGRKVARQLPRDPTTGRFVAP